jgi:2-iminobutanoate/2-iminopropanoate deaminase
VKEIIGGVQAVPLAAAIKTENFVFVSGQVPTDENGQITGDIKEQTTACLRKIESLLKEAGSSMSNVVKTTVFITDVADFAAMNEAYAQFFDGNPPARSCVRADLVIDAKVEIEAIAIL